MKILIVEDHPLLGASVKQGLEDQSWTVDWARDGEEGLFLVQKSAYDLALVDCMLPKMDGLTLAHRIRELNPKTAMIMITARGALDDRLKGLEVTDDYIVKPFEMSELIARIKSVYRRAMGSPKQILELGLLNLDMGERTAKVGSELLTLTAKEFDLLRILMSRAGQVCMRTELSGLMYGYEDEPSSNSLDVLIARLRKKIQDSHVEIATVRGQGFILRANS